MAFAAYEEDIEIARPPVKWAGGKSQLIPQFEPLFPDKIDCLVEPFVGGGAVFFYVRPRKAILIDNNSELINFYLILRDKPDELLNDLLRHKNDKEYYYQVREQDPAFLSDVERASRFLFLNKTCYNGLFRVNRHGKFNVPFGKYKNPKIIDEPNLRSASAALQRAEIICADFTSVLDVAEQGMFVYCDPPYHPLSETAYFTSYTKDSFHEKDQRRLAEVFKELDAGGCRVMLSNSDTPFIRELYKDFDLKVVTARRAINCRGNKRGPVTELVVRNYK